MNTYPEKRPLTRADVRGLRSRVGERAVFPTDASWETARLAWNLAADQRPAAVVYAESAADVIATIEFAKENDFRVAPQGTGHGAAALEWDGSTILLKTERMRAVSIDPVAQRARVEAGTLWLEVTEPAAEHGLAALHGSSPDVGVVGYSLGGGIGWYARRHGLATNSVLAIEVVTADGTLVRADSENEPDLFWALRGGGGNFGVVTAIEFRLYPIAEAYAGVLFWPADRGTEVLQAWREWVDTVPDEVTSVGRFLTMPPIPEVPEPLRGRAFVIVEAAYLGDESAGRELIGPLRALEPEIDTFSMVPAAALTWLHMDPEHPVPGAGDGLLLDSVSAETIDALVTVAGSESGSSLLSVELRHLGGALARQRPGHGALATLDAAFAMYAVGIAATPELKAAVEVDVERVKHALAPWTANRGYMNFTESSGDAGRLFADTTYGRLRKVKAAVDPDGLFVANHKISAQAARRAS